MIREDTYTIFRAVTPTSIQKPIASAVLPSPESYWFPTSLTNIALFNAILFTTDACQFGWRTSYERPKGIQHMQAAVHAINKSLKDQAAGVEDATIAAVVILALGEVSTSFVYVIDTDTASRLCVAIWRIGEYICKG